MVFHKRKGILFTLFFVIGCLLFAGNTATCEAAASPYKNTVTPKTNTYIYIYKKNSTKSDKIGTFSQGDGAKLLKKGSTWYKIKSGKITGYVKKKSVLTGAKLEAYAKKNNFPKTVKIKVRSLNVRQKASKKSAVVTGVKKGETYSVLKETNKWAKIQAEGGTGYVLKQYTSWSYDLSDAGEYTTASSSTTTTTTDISQFSDIAVCCVDANKRLNIRQEASTSSAVIGYMTPGSSAKIVDKGTEWTKIQSGSLIGYINNDYYYTGSRVDSYARQIGLEKIATLKVNMNIRAKASVSSKRIGGASAGATFSVTKETASWVAITFNGKTGYLKKSYLTLTYNFGTPVAVTVTTTPEQPDGTTTIISPPAGSVSGAKIVEYALQFLGNPYVYGGTSLTQGCDCSGFVMSIYKAFGYSIPRVSRDQAKGGTEISIDSIQAGDLLFYANSSGTINHVGLYMGNGRIINASNEKVGITTYKYNYRTPVKAVRYLK